MNTSIIKKISNYETISFDLFDTLVERMLEKPEDVYLFLDRYAKSRYDIDNFYDIRKKIKKLYPQKTQELTLDKRYTLIHELHKIPLNIVNDLMNYELAIERRVLQQKRSGIELLKISKQQNKRVIIISDTYFSKDFIIEILKKLHIYNYIDEIYTSSEVGKTKLHGSLYQFVLQNEKSNNILHIGDNKKSDYTNARNSKIDSYLIKSSFDTYKKIINKKLYVSPIQDPLSKSITIGVFTHYLSNIDFLNNKNTNLFSPYHIGFFNLGILFTTFSIWISKIKKEKKISNLYFLSRDGRIIKEVYNIIFGKDRTHYLLSSRRAASVANIKNKSDIIELLDKKFFKMTLKELLLNKFGLSEDFINTINLKQFNFQYLEEEVTYKFDRDKLIALLTDDYICTAIIHNAQNECLNYKSYLQKNNLTSNTKPESFALIDIGHSGTIQKSIAELLNIKKTNGLYLATNDKSISTLQKHNKFSFLANEISNKSNHYYQKNMLMFEFMFSNEEGSLVKFDDNINPITLTSTQEKQKILIKEIHEGIKDFSKMIKIILGNEVDFWTISKEESSAFFLDFLEFPNKKKIKPFLNITLENTFSGDSDRQLISKKRNKGFWKQASLIYKYPLLTPFRSLYLKLKNKLISK